MHTIERLADVPLFSGLQPGELQLISRCTRRRPLAANTTVLYQGIPGTALYVILTGRAKVHKATPDGQDVVMAILRPGQLFGELSLLDGNPCSADVTIMEQAEALVLTRDDLMECIRQAPQIAFNLLTTLTDRLRRANALIEAMSTLDAPGLVAWQLLSLARDHGMETPHGVQIGVRLPQTELAAMVGSTRETVTRTLSHFRSLGWLAIDKQHRITLRQLDQLARRCEG
jgi:CRP/FNR family transcriptional regulator, cyclic AMP receptor protein